MAANLIAGKSYDPATAASFSIGANSAMTAFDTTNLRLTFTAPANGIVLVRIRCTVVCASVGGAGSFMLGVLSGSSVIARQWPLNIQAIGAATASTFAAEALFTVSGLVGSNTWDAAFAVQVFVAGANINFGGPNDALGSDAWGGFQFEIYTTERLLASTLYDPAVAVAVPTTVTQAMTAFDTTNLRLTFTAPISGSVFVRLRVAALQGSSTNQPVVLLGILDGTAVRIRTAPVALTRSPGPNANGFESRGVVTGLAGNTSYTWDAAFAIQNTLSSSLNYGGPNNSSGNNAWGGFLYEIWAM